MYIPTNTQFCAPCFLDVVCVYDGDQAPNDQVNIPTVQPSQEKGSQTQELAQIIKNIMTAQSAQIPAHIPVFVSLITQA